MPEGHATTVQPAPSSAWACQVTAAALTRGTAVTTVTYGRACAAFMALTVADLQGRLAAMTLAASTRHNPYPGC